MDFYFIIARLFEILCRTGPCSVPKATHSFSFLDAAAPDLFRCRKHQVKEALKKLGHAPGRVPGMPMVARCRLDILRPMRAGGYH